MGVVLCSKCVPWVRCCAKISKMYIKSTTAQLNRFSGGRGQQGSKYFKLQIRGACTACVLCTFCKLLCKHQLNVQLKRSTAQVHKYNMFQRGVRVNRGPGTSNQIAHNCCKNTNGIQNTKKFNCTSAHVPGRVRGWMGSRQRNLHPGGQWPLHLWRGGSRKVTSYFHNSLDSPLSCSEQLIGYIYSCKICSWKGYSSINYPPSNHPDVFLICTYNFFDLVRKSPQPIKIIGEALSF